MTSKNEAGKTSSIQPISFAKRFNIRPIKCNFKLQIRFLYLKNGKEHTNRIAVKKEERCANQGLEHAVVKVYGRFHAHDEKMD
jgi:hypothetical protein